MRKSSEKPYEKALQEATAILAFCDLTRDDVFRFCIRKGCYPSGVTPDGVVRQMKRERIEAALKAAKHDS